MSKTEFDPIMSTLQEALERRNEQLSDNILTPVKNPDLESPTQQINSTIANSEDRLKIMLEKFILDT